AETRLRSLQQPLENSHDSRHDSALCGQPRARGSHRRRRAREGSDRRAGDGDGGRRASAAAGGREALNPVAVLKEFCFRPAVDGPNRPVICVSPAQSKVIGRSADADAVVDEPSLSRQHARLSMAPDGAVTVEDLGSTNGVFVNGTQRRVATLVPGDVVRLGAVEFKTDTGRSRTEFPDGSMVRRRQADRAVVDRAALEALLSTSREIMAFGDLQGLLDRVLDRLQAILTQDRSAILLIDPATGDLVPRSVRPAGAYQNVSDFASSTAVHESLSSREVLVVEDAKADERLRNAASVMQAGVRSAISVPLLGRS